MESKITIWGMEQYLQRKQDSLFKNIKVPELCDADVLKDTCLLEAGEFDCIYSDPYFLKSAIRVFFDRKFAVYDKWFYNLSFAKEYNPIENFDQITEEHTDKHTHNKDTQSQLTNNLVQTNMSTLETDNTQTHNTKNETVTDGEVKTSNDSTRTPNLTNVTENQVSAFDSTSYSNKDKATTTQTGNERTSVQGKTEDDTKVTSTNTGTIKDESSTTNNGTIKDTGTATTKNTGKDTDVEEYGRQRVHGCVGVKSSGALLKEDVEFYRQLDLYKMIATEFVDEFCVLLY